jgi:acyl carrier protein
VQPPWDATFEEVLRGALPELPSDVSLLPTSDLRALGLNSMALVELIIRLEDAFDADFDEEALDYQTFSSPQGLWDAVRRLSSSAAEKAAS